MASSDILCQLFSLPGFLAQERWIDVLARFSLFILDETDANRFRKSDKIYCCRLGLNKVMPFKMSQYSFFWTISNFFHFSRLPGHEWK